jgi:hypothetical protein
MLVAAVDNRLPVTVRFWPILLKNSNIASPPEQFEPMSDRRVGLCPAGRAAMQISPMSLCVALKGIGVTCATCVLQLGTRWPRRSIEFFNRIDPQRHFKMQ